ncbi:50S rRNA methyltransferase [Candidatus Saccharibacteria bacterium 32-49-10]|nr:MAG: 50S rRNA methyltransferase [Candidatus Saccharibacteria bacterium 32-49-10]
MERFIERLRPPFAATFEIIPHSGKSGDGAVREESEKIEKRLSSDDAIILLDERGKNLSSPELAAHIERLSSQNIVIIIGGAYGVDETIYERADFVWSLSSLVFPHQLVRLLLTEQLYRAQEIASNNPYHHA